VLHLSLLGRTLAVAGEGPNDRLTSCEGGLGLAQSNTSTQSRCTERVMNNKKLLRGGLQKSESFVNEELVVRRISTFRKLYRIPIRSQFTSLLLTGVSPRNLYGHFHRRNQPHLATMRVMSSCCSRGLNCRTSSTIAASMSCGDSSRCRRKASIRRSSPNSSAASLNDSVTPSV
jgi:hypothetical protein